MSRKILAFIILIFIAIYTYCFKQSYYEYTYGLLDIQKMNYKSAIEKFEYVIKTDPQAVDVYQQLIYLYIIENQKDKLKSLCDKIENVITDVDALIDIANTLLTCGYKDIAVNILEKVLLFNNTNKEAILTLAQIYFSSDTKKSLHYYKQYHKIYPEDTSVYLPIAILEYQSGNLYEAKKFLQKVFNISQEEKILQLLTTLFSSTTDYDLLIENYEKFIETEPKDYKMIGVIFSTLVNEKKLDKAEKYLNKLLSIPKKEFLPEYNFYIAIYYEYKGLPLVAAKFMQKFIKSTHTNDEIPYVKLAYYYILLKQYNKAIKVLSIANKKFNTESVKTLLLYTYLDNKDYHNAISILYELKSISSSFKRVDFYLGYCYDQLKDFQKTEMFMLEAVKKNPDDHEALNYLGYFYADRNINLNEAEQLILKALSYEPTNYAYIDSLAWVYYKKGMYKKAEELFEKIKDCNDPIVYEHIGDVKYKLNKTKEALEFYKKSLMLAPKNKNLKTKIKKLTSK